VKKNIETILDDVVNQLSQIGQLIRRHRKLFKIKANSAIETEGIPREALHRIEKGEPSVSIDAYRNVISSLNLNFYLAASGDVGYEGNINRVGQLPVCISLADCPQLNDLAWHG
jgi:hypothetical protein